jgi:hypothetical protein
MNNGEVNFWDHQVVGSGQIFWFAIFNALLPSFFDEEKYYLKNVFGIKINLFVYLQGLHLDRKFCDDASDSFLVDLCHEPDAVEDDQEVLQQEQEQDHQQAEKGSEDSHAAHHCGRLLHWLQHDQNLC